MCFVQSEVIIINISLLLLISLCSIITGIFIGISIEKELQEAIREGVIRNNYTKRVNKFVEKKNLK